MPSKTLIQRRKPYEAPKESSGSIIRESLVSGFATGAGLSIAERVVTGLFGPRIVNVTTGSIPEDRCQQVEHQFIACLKTRSYETPSCKNEQDAFYQCHTQSR